LPAAYRANWVASVADALVRNTPDRALNFLEQQRGQPGYDQAVITVVNQLAATNQHQPKAAELIDTVAWSEQLRPAAVNLGTAWAQSDPRAASAWAVRLQRPGPISAVATGWARVDPGAAESWALTLPSGALRDAGINPVLMASAQSGEPKLALLDALSTDAVRQQSATRVAIAVGRTDPARARALVDTYISDPAIRQRAEQQLAQPGRGVGPGRAGGAPMFLDLEAMQEALRQ
jgi:hypothetical protein